MKDVVDYVTACHGYSERKACALTRQHRSTQRKPMISNPHTAIRQRMHEIVRTRIRYGYRRVHILLRREGWSVGRNLIYRLYRGEGLILRGKRPRRRKMVVHREARCCPKRPNEAWSLDFVHDQLSNGQKFRTLTVVDVFSRESLAIEVGQRLRGEHVVECLNRLVRQHGAPKYLLPTMAPNLPVISSISGLTITAHGLTSHGQASQRIMPSSKASTAKRRFHVRISERLF